MINSEEVEKSILNKSLTESKLPSLDQYSLNQQAFFDSKNTLRYETLHTCRILKCSYRESYKLGAKQDLT
jgi:hypothetical protein